MNLREAWCHETSSDPNNWTPENPAWGQCAVTALVIQDLLGGKLVRAKVNGISHYWNEVDRDGASWIDFTLEQFGDGALSYEDGPTERTREYVLGFPETKRRYELLRARIGWPTTTSTEAK